MVKQEDFLWDDIKALHVVPSELEELNKIYEKLKKDALLAFTAEAGDFGVTKYPNLFHIVCELKLSVNDDRV